MNFREANVDNDFQSEQEDEIAGISGSLISGADDDADGDDNREEREGNEFKCIKPEDKGENTPVIPEAKSNKHKRQPNKAEINTKYSRQQYRKSQPKKSKSNYESPSIRTRQYKLQHKNVDHQGAGKNHLKQTSRKTLIDDIKGKYFQISKGNEHNWKKKEVDNFVKKRNHRYRQRYGEENNKEEHNNRRYNIKIAGSRDLDNGNDKDVDTSNINNSGDLV